MNIIELKQIFEDENIPRELYSLKGGLPNESYCIKQLNEQWEVYYSERGSKSSSRFFDTEDEACLHLYKCVKRML